MRRRNAKRFGGQVAKQRRAKRDGRKAPRKRGNLRKVKMVKCYPKPNRQSRRIMRPIIRVFRRSRSGDVRVRSVALAKKRSIGRAFGLKERSGIASAGFTTECTEVHGRLGNVAARCLSSRTFRNTLSTPSAADSEFSPVITERASGSHLKPRGRKFAESDAFFGGAGSGADKFCLLPQTSVLSVVET